MFEGVRRKRICGEGLGEKMWVSEIFPYDPLIISNGIVLMQFINEHAEIRETLVS